jgi:transcriptional regulator with XRE-family HTH domain
MLSENLNYLRKKSKLSQQSLSEDLGIPRTTLGDYERGKTEPNIEMLVKMASYFKVSVDSLIGKNISHEDLEIIRNKDMRVLAISVDGENRQNIELVDSKAEAGYLESFQDPEYIRELPKIQFPNMPEGTFRGFEIRGDSMLPMESGSIVLCSYVERISDLKSRKTYVVATRRDGLVYKRVQINKSGDGIVAISDNDVYPPYEIPFAEISELWQYYAHLSFSDSKTQLENIIEERLLDIQKTVNSIEAKVS